MINLYNSAGKKYFDKSLQPPIKRVPYFAIFYENMTPNSTGKLSVCQHALIYCSEHLLIYNGSHTLFKLLNKNSLVAYTWNVSPYTTQLGWALMFRPFKMDFMFYISSHTLAKIAQAVFLQRPIFSFFISFQIQILPGFEEQCPVWKVFSG